MMGDWALQWCDQWTVMPIFEVFDMSHRQDYLTFVKTWLQEMPLYQGKVEYEKTEIK